MMNMQYRKLALLLGALVLGACGSDGKDGADGAPGAPGTPGEPGKPGQDLTHTPVTSSLTTHLEVIDYRFDEGSISYEFEITDENGNLINGLESAEAKVAAATDKGFINNRDGMNGGAATMSTEGAVLEVLGDGHYRFIAPMPAVNAGTDGIVWLRVGGSRNTAIARSSALVVNKPEGSFSTTTESCYSCHVDYSLSPRRHSSYVAEGMDGNIDFVAGCLVCHGSVSRTMEGGSYASNTLSKIGHINHQAFTTNFSVMNCSSCHVDVTANINIVGPGCIDCHDAGATAAGDILPANGLDLRKMHEAAAGISYNTSIVNRYKISGTPLAQNAAGQWCTTMSLYGVDENGETLLNLQAMTDEDQTAHNADKPVRSTSAYIHAYYNSSFGARISNRYDASYDADGNKTMCFNNVDLTAYPGVSLVASLRLTFTGKNYATDTSDLASIQGYTDVVDPNSLSVAGFDRRHVVSDSACATCHNSGTDFHRAGSFSEGGIGCIGCHNNGQDRRAGSSAPGFGPMVHSMHWGVGSVDGEGNANAASAINPQSSCVACHADGVSLNDIPNQFIKARAYGTSNKMASPITANCYACHTGAAALSHMQQNGGEIDRDVTDTWYMDSTTEACAVCHETGKAYGIDKYHKF
ncbi:multiheme c-type cytochrome [Shewanella sp. YIC-542]|uniref:multiheme c-type cytochrome n=1 Tax=Shewanella mytili TaxID=3377111 RepID=UPI00398EB224